jgi:hypothetical protein
MSHHASDKHPTSAYTALADGNYQSSVLTRGPWHPDHQHAGPPIALVCRAVETAAREHGLTHISRLTANLLRPVPIKDLSITVTPVYVGRNAGHFAVQLVAEGKEVGVFTALAQRESDFVVPEGIPGHPLPTLAMPPADAKPAHFPFHGRHVGYSDLMETRTAHGEIFNGPCAIWFRMRHPLVEGETPSAYQRVAVAADSGNGISAVLDYERYSFVNSDLTINLLRHPQGEWMALESRTCLGANGCGLAESALYDELGLVGRSTQSLVVRAR